MISGEVIVDKGISGRSVNLFNLKKKKSSKFIVFCVSEALSRTLKLLELQGCSSVFDTAFWPSDKLTVNEVCMEKGKPNEWSCNNQTHDARLCEALTLD